MRKIFFILLGALLFTSSMVQAQDRSHYYTHLLHPFLINPAAASSDNSIRALFNARTMLGGIDGSPRTINFGLHGGLANDAGLGLKVINDWLGVFQTTNIEMAYSKKVLLSSEQSLHFGLSLGVIQTNLKSDLINGSVNLADPNLTDPNLNRIRIASGAGFIYKFADKFELSTSFPTLVTGDDKINGFFVSSVNYKFKLGEQDKFTVKPIVNYYNMQYSDKMFDAMLHASWNDMLSLTGAYRSNGSIIMGAGTQFNSFSVQYLYYHHTGDLNGLAPAQNEIAIGFAFNKPKKEIKPKKLEFGEDAFSQDLSKINQRVNGLIQVQQSNPGLVDMKKAIADINTDLNKLLQNNKVSSAAHLKLIKSIQESIDLMIATNEK
ncbi:MAG: PorP/SprF family type IX secretion system membrane protein [Bacteroidota bacterium]|nr:PorP/SprF family type IX secretion system membrane protein [Bacteroidota bacterium]